MKEKIYRILFDWGAIIKIIDGAVEALGGLLLLFLTKSEMNRIIRFITLHELVEDPKDAVANYTVNFLRAFSFNERIFAAIYLLLHGLIKAFLIWSALKNRLWAYPASIIFVGIFMIYQIYRLSYGFSWFLFALTVLDAIVIYLIWHEYDYRKNRSVAKP